MQTKIYVEPFSGEHKDFQKSEIGAKAIFEVEGLENCLDLVFLAKMPAKDHELDDNNEAHQKLIKAKRMNAKAYALLTTMIRGRRFFAKFARLKQLYANSDVPKAACRYLHKLQEIYRPDEDTDDVTIEKELRKLTINHTDDPEELVLRIAAIVNKHKCRLPLKRKKYHYHLLWNGALR